MRSSFSFRSLSFGSIALWILKFSVSNALRQGISFFADQRVKTKIGSSSHTIRTNRRIDHLLLAPQCERASLSLYSQKLFSTSNIAVDTEVNSSKETRESPPWVQRNFETFRWKNKYNINYRVEGPVGGQPILLVHGFGANVNHFRYQFPPLVDEGYRVYAVDLLGFGASDKPKEEDYCIELWGELLVDFIGSKCEELPASTSWVIAGNSIGGLLSLVVSESIPENIRGCVLFNCAGGMTGFRYEELPFMLKPILYFVQNVVLKGPLGKSFFKNFKTRENVESILKTQGVYRDQSNVDDELLEILLGPSDDSGAEDVFLKVFGGPPGPTPESILPNVKCPILALWGDADPWTPLDQGLHPGSMFGNYTENFTLVALPNTGHCPHDETPDLCHDSMLPWLRQLV